MESLKIGSTIPLKAQLVDGATNKYVRAVVRNSSDVEISGSPFALSHVATGLYTNNAALMPNSNISVQFFVYSDSGFTTLDTTYAITSIDYILDTQTIAGELTAKVSATELTAKVGDEFC